MMASTNPVASAPASSAITVNGPNSTPTTIGATTARIDGTTISRCAPLVEMPTQDA